MLDDDYDVGEFRIPLHGWIAERRFVVIREQVREWPRQRRPQADRCPRLYLRVFVTSCGSLRRRSGGTTVRCADMENHIAELQHDLGADGFCRKQFFATEAAFRAVLLLFNLLAEFQRGRVGRRFRDTA